MAISLRAFSSEHIPLILVACVGWQELAQHGPPYWRPRSEAELTRKVAASAGHSLAGEYNFVIDDDGRLVGECSIHAIDWRSRVSQVGICIWDPADRQSGQGRKALDELLHWAGGHLDMARLEAWILADNHASRRLFAQAGFSHEGTLQGRCLQDSRRHDVEVFGRLWGTSD